MNNEQLIRKFLDAENRRDWQTWQSCLADDIEYEVVGSSETSKGKSTYFKKMQATYSELHDWKFEVINLVSNKNVVITEFDGSGHFTGTYEDRGYVDVPMVSQAICIFVVANGLISKVKEYWDSTGFRRQLQHSQARWS